MRLNRRRLLTGACTSLGIAALPRVASSQQYPARPVRVIVPFAAGGPNDLAARIIAQGLSDQLGKQFYVENIGGAGGNIGAGQASKAAADGYTIFVASPSYVVNPTLFETVPYDIHKSFDCSHARRDGADRAYRAPDGSGEDSQGTCHPH
jgi:tripartite-type tricarboxylate transporter receptor subunit TctC